LSAFEDEKGERVLEREVFHKQSVAVSEALRQCGAGGVVFEASAELGLVARGAGGRIPNVARIHRGKSVSSAADCRSADSRPIRSMRASWRSCCGWGSSGLSRAGTGDPGSQRGSRQRAYWVRQRTGIRNRIHKLIGRQPGLQMPQVSDLFGAKGKAALKKAALPEPDGMLLKQTWQMLEPLDGVIRADEERIRAMGKPDRSVGDRIQRAGRGLVVIGQSDGDGDRRDRPVLRPDGYVGYAGCRLDPQFGRQDLPGRMWAMQQVLKWAFIEASWIASAARLNFGGCIVTGASVARRPTPRLRSWARPHVPHRVSAVE